MPTVADHIEQHRESLLERFLAQVSRLLSAQGLTPHELLNTTPEYIATLAALSRRGRREAPQETKARLEETHISFRMRLGYALEEVQEEYEVMRRLITGLWRDGPAEAQPPDEDVRLLHEELDSARAQAASAFRGYSLQEWQGERRAVRQLDALIPEVIGPADSPRPLRERLAPLVEVVRIALQADEAFLFLAGEDGAPLVPAASARRGQRPGPVAEAPAELASFVARVAASEELVHLPATQEGGGASAEAPAAGTSWLGLRLWPHDKLLGALVAQVVDEVRLSVPERHIEVRHEGAGAAEVDADRLAQVVTNLLTNALQYSPPDAPVHVVSRAEDGELVLEVHNAGPPIPASLLPSLFEPLRRGQESGASSSRGLGSRSIGLGLYIVRELVQAHGGSISVRSREAEGTTFTVRLPRSPPPAALAARA